jgi:hypothetical protein
LNANNSNLFGEWSFLGCFHEKLTINDFLKKTHQFEEINMFGHKNFSSFSFYKSFNFHEIGATSEKAAYFKLNNKCLTVFLNKTNIIYDFDIIYMKGKKLILFDKLSHLYYYFLKNKNSNHLMKIKNNNVRIFKHSG